MEFLETSDSSKYVYHYTTSDTALKHILPNMTLRASRLRDTRDPLEVRNRITQFNIPMLTLLGLPIDCEHVLNSPKNMGRLIHAPTRRVEAGIRLLCTTADKIRDGLHTPTEMRGYGHSRMWTQYADFHSGVCLVLKRDLLDTSVHANAGGYRVTVDRVTYGIISDLRKNLTKAETLSLDEQNAQHIEATARAHIIKNTEWLLYTKPLDYRDESEVRWVVYANESDPEFLIDIRGALSAIILGERNHSSFLPSFRALCALHNLPIYRITTYRGEFQTPQEVALA